MPELKKTEKGVSLEFSAEEARELGLNPAREYEAAKAKPGIFLLTEGKEKSPRTREVKLDKRLSDLLERANLSDRVEGKFEKKLGAEEKKHFEKMKGEGKIVPFRLSDKYKKAIYKTKREIDSDALIKHPAEKTRREPSSIEEAFSLERDDFTVTKSEGKAKELSDKFREQIKKKEILGVKSFDGDYVVIKKELYEKHSPEVLRYIKGHSPVSADALSDALNLKKPLVKVVCEFLREEGEITEKRKELYSYVT